MNNTSYDEPIFAISIVSRMLKLHPQTLRQYEKEGLIAPSRTQGRIRQYSQRDVDKIKTILRLTRDLGVNLAGVDIILQLKEKIDALDELLATLRAQKGSTTEVSVQNSSFELVVFGKE